MTVDKDEFQNEVYNWCIECFGREVLYDIVERNHRFLEESLELVQTTGATQSECHQLVDYVFNRPIGETKQELGGVMVTLAALSNAVRLSMYDAGWFEVARIWAKIEKIREKQAAKPKHSPLPQSVTPQTVDKEAILESHCHFVSSGDYWHFKNPFLYQAILEAMDEYLEQGAASLRKENEELKEGVEQLKEDIAQLENNSKHWCEKAMEAANQRLQLQSSNEAKEKECEYWKQRCLAAELLMWQDANIYWPNNYKNWQALKNKTQ